MNVAWWKQNLTLVELLNNYTCIPKGKCKYTWFSLRASSPGRSGGGAGKERRALEFEYLHQKSLCKMLSGADNISNDVITLGTCFSMFVYIRARFRFALIGGNLTA